MKKALVATLLLLTAITGGGTARAESLVLASAFSLSESGLLAKILPVFTAKTGIEVKVLVLASGDAMDTAAQGRADLVLVNAPAAEAAFVAAEHWLPPREIAWNDFLLVGPKTDAAGIGGTRDAIAALRAIAAKSVPFVTRGDNSSIYANEKQLWKKADIDPLGKDWYHTINAGMMAALRAAAAMEAAALTDRASWISFQNKGDLIPLVAGDAAFLNRYDVIQLNPAKHPTAKLGPAKGLAEWLASPEGQHEIGELRKNGEQLFHPDADHPYPH